MADKHCTNLKPHRAHPWTGNDLDAREKRSIQHECSGTEGWIRWTDDVGVHQVDASREEIFGTPAEWEHFDRITDSRFDRNVRPLDLDDSIRNMIFALMAAVTLIFVILLGNAIW